MMELFYPFTYSLSFVTDSILTEKYRVINYLFLPVFLFNPFNFEMTRVTITTSNANVRSPLATVYALCVLRIDTIGGNILVHDSVKCGGFMKIKYGVFPREGEGTI
jgi:hypothetical protein